MPDTIKKTVAYLIIAFLLFYLLTQPVAFAGVVRSLGIWLRDGFDALLRFFSALTS